MMSSLPKTERGLPQLKAALPPHIDVVMLPYHIAFDAEGRPTFTYYRERLIRRLAGLRWQGAVHEAIAPVGNVLYYDKTAVTPPKAPSQRPRPEPAHPGAAAGPGEGPFPPGSSSTMPGSWTPMAAQEEAAALWEAFLAEDQGWVENKREACRDLSACYLRMGQEEKAFAALNPGTGFWAAPGGALLRPGKLVFPAGRLPHSSVLV